MVWQQEAETGWSNTRDRWKATYNFQMQSDTGLFVASGIHWVLSEKLLSAIPKVHSKCCGVLICSRWVCCLRNDSWISLRRPSFFILTCMFCPPFPFLFALSLLQWQAISLTVIEKVQIAAAILGSLFLIASISWLIWSTFSPSAKWQRQDLLFQICYGMYGFMDIVCIGEWMTLKVTIR